MNKKGRLLDNVISILLDVLLGIFSVVLVISIYNSVQIHVLGNDYSSFFGYSTFEVETGSMAPAISAGDWIVIKKAQNIMLNDIVTFKKDGEFITHRVIESYKNTFITKGDANNGKDDAINRDQIVGVVVKILPKFGIIRKTLFNPVVLIVLIISIILVGYLFRGKNNTAGGYHKTTSLLDGLIPRKNKDNNEFVTEIDISSNTVKVEDTDIEKHEEKDEVDKIISEKDEEILKEKNLNTEKEVLTEEDLDKTIYFRMINVDASEVDSSYEVVVEEDEDEEVAPVKKEKVKKEEKEEIIQNRRKKFKNVIDKIMYLKREELLELTNILNKKEKLKVNEAQIRTDLLEAYIDGKYYNFCGDVNKEYNKKNMLLRLDGALKFKGESLVKKYKGKDEFYKEKVDKYVELFILLSSLEKVYLITPKINDKRDAYLKKIKKTYKDINDFDMKRIIEDMLKCQKMYSQKTNEVLTQQDSTTFELEYKNISKVDNLFSVDLKHNIGFSKVYSDYIIDKTYDEGIVAEEKTIITLNLLFVRLIKDVFGSDFSNKYVIYVPESTYSKTNKLNKVFDMLEDEYAKNNIIILVDYNCFIKNKKVINNLKKLGYHFAVNINKNNEVKPEKIKNISICDYVFIDKDCKDADYYSLIPENLVVVNENLIERFISNGGK